MTDLVEQLLAEAGRGKVLPVYLFHGEPYSLPGDAARRLVEVLIPARDRDFALSVHEGGRERASEILDDANSLSLLSGRRVILVKDTPLLLSKRDAKKVVEACRERWEAAGLGAARPAAVEDTGEPEEEPAAGWEEGRDEEAAAAEDEQGAQPHRGRSGVGSEAQRHRAAADLAALLASAGWGLGHLLDDSEEAAGRWQKDFGIRLGTRSGEWAEFARWLKAVHEFCVERGIDLPETAGERETLERGIERGLPPGNILVLTARRADPSLALYKTIERVGAAVPVKVDEKDAAAFTRATAERVARALGVRISPQALARLEGLLEPNPERIEREVEKLASLAGPGAEITPEHVEAAIGKTRQDPVYRLQEAIAERNLALALALLGEALGQGSLPMQARALGALGATASIVRKLLRMRALIEGPLKGRLRGEPTYAAFQAKVLPALAEEPRAAAFRGRHPFGLWKDWLRALRFTTAELADALARLARADRALKLSPTDPRLVLEDALLPLLAPRAGRGTGRTE